MAFGNIIFGGVIGAGVDISTGAAYDYPSLITVMMGKSGVAVSPHAPAAAPQGQGAPNPSTASPPASAPSILMK